MTAKKLENNSNHAVIAEEVKILTDLLDESTRHLVGDEEFAKIKGLVKIAASSDHSQLESQIACLSNQEMIIVARYFATLPLLINITEDVDLATEVNLLNNTDKDYLGKLESTVDLVAEELGLTEAYGQLLPEDKAEFVKKRQAAGEIVAFVGDGINDSPSLARADIGIAMGSGTDVAIETSNVVLMNGSFDRIPRALALAKATRRNMIENITIALVVVAVLLISVLASSWMNMPSGCLPMKAVSWL